MFRTLLACATLAVAGVNPLSAQSIAGDWNASMNTPGGAINFAIMFKQNGDTLSGTVHRTSGDVALAGMVKKDSVFFSYTITYNDHDLVMSVASKVTGNAMTGTIDFGGQGGDEFKAERLVAKKP